LLVLITQVYHDARSTECEILKASEQNKPAILKLCALKAQRLIVDDCDVERVPRGTKQSRKFTMTQHTVVTRRNGMLDAIRYSRTQL